MPYIKQDDRMKFDEGITSIIDALEATYDEKGFVDVGQLNYIVSSIVWRLFDSKPSYTNANNLIGVLECVKQEFIRRRLNDYEDGKIKSNGDII